MDNLLSTILIVCVILVLVFLIFREINCWYWKINERISLQKEQNLILNKILKELKNIPKSMQKTSSSQNGDDYNKDKTINEDGLELDSKEEEMISEIKLTIAEQKQVDAFYKFGFKPGDRLVINKITRLITRFEKNEWNLIDQSEWIILFEN